MRFSIVVPSYNEEEDIRETLDSLVALDYEDKEVIVVDDSTDSTPKIIRTYEPKGVRLIRPAIREGRCGARNIGIRASTGDVVVILNADVRLPRDFLNKILPFYEQGFDYVLVKAKVSNTEFLFARYVEAKNILDHYQDDSSWLEWTEGFSCRREVAIKAGLFPTGYPVLICAGKRISQWKDRRREIEVPLFSCYCFVRVSKLEWKQVRMVTGVLDIVGNGDHSEAIPNEEIDAIKKLMTNVLPYDAYPYLREGVQIEVVRGPLQGTKGTLFRKGKMFRLIIGIHLIQQAVIAEVDANDVAPL